MCGDGEKKKEFSEKKQTLIWLTRKINVVE